MSAVASIVIQVDETGAISAFNSVGTALKSVEAAANSTGNAGAGAGDKMNKGFTQARQSAMLLREETGIFLPRALQNVIAKSEILGPLMKSAFSGFAVLGFIDLISSIPKHIENGIEAFTHWKAEAEATTKSIGEMNKELLSLNKQIEEAQRRSQAAGLAPIGKAQVDLASSVADVLQQQKIVDDLQKKADDARKAVNMVGGGIGPNGEDVPGYPMPKYTDEQLVQYTAPLTEAQKKLELLKIEAQGAGQALDEAFGKNQQENARKLTEEIDKQQAAIKKFREEQGRGQDIMDKAMEENNAKIAENTDKRLRDEQDVQDKMMEATVERYNKAEESDRHYAEEQTRAQQKAIEEQKRYADEWIQQRDRMANSIATLFEDITSGNIGSRFKKMFEQLVAEMVANWMMGVNAMGAVTAGGLGGAPMGGLNRGGGPLGLLSSVFGLSGRSQGIGFPNSLAGGSGGFAGIGTPSFSDVGTSDISLGLGGSLSSGLPTFGVGGLPAGAGVTGTAAAPQGLGSLFSNGGLSTLLAAGGSLAGLSLIGSQNPALRGIGGAGLGFGIGSLAGPLLTSFAESGFLSGALGLGSSTLLAGLGAVAGPIGAAIGGIIALASALGPKHQQDRHNFEMAELDSIAKVVSAYQNNSTDYKSAVQALEQMRQAGDQQFATWGASNHAGEQVDAHIDLAESQLSSAEATRQAQLQAQAAEQARRAGLSFGPALFSQGGPVGSFSGTVPPWFAASARYYASGGDVVPAMLTPEEFVVRAPAAQKIGRARLDRMNATGDVGGDELHIHIHAVDAPSFQALLDKGLDKQIAAAIIKLRYQGIKVA